MPSLEQFVADFVKVGGSREHAEYQWKKLGEDEVWVNDEYQVNIDRTPEHGFGPDTEIWHVSVKRRGRPPIHDWRDLQAIKNTLVGGQYDAVELYPKQERTIDGANQYHLWVFIRADGQDAPTLPLGWHVRSVVTNPKIKGAVQRPLHGAGAVL
jgi:hypothetical protein